MECLSLSLECLHVLDPLVSLDPTCRQMTLEYLESKKQILFLEIYYIGFVYCSLYVCYIHEL